MALLLPLAVLAVAIGRAAAPRALGTQLCAECHSPPPLPFCGGGRTRFPSCAGVGVRDSCGEKSPPPAAAATKPHSPSHPGPLSSSALLGCTIPAALALLESCSPCPGGNPRVPLLQCRWGVPTEPLGPHCHPTIGMEGFKPKRCRKSKSQQIREPGNVSSAFPEPSPASCSTLSLSHRGVPSSMCFHGEQLGLEGVMGDL